MTRYALHIGVLPVDGDAASVDRSTALDYQVYSDTYVAGSWTVWCEPDNPDDVITMHVVRYIETDSGDGEDDDEIVDGVAILREALKPIITGRLTDYAVVSNADDWSKDQMVVLPDTRVLYNAIPAL